MKFVHVLIAVLLTAATAQAQSVSAVLSRDTIRVGDPLRVVVRVDRIPANTDVLLPDSLASADDVENAGRVRVRRDTLEADGTRVTAAYPIIVWRPGETALPLLPMVVRSDAGERTLQITLPVVNVLSVLPADTTNIEAKPPKDVWGADRLWWPWLIAAALLLLLIGLLIWWWRRRKAEVAAPVIPVIDPRERALQELQRIRQLRLIEQSQFKQHYILLSEVLRIFAAGLQSDWSTDLTTTELAPRLKRRPDASPLLRVLKSADMVKFARREPSATEARNDLDAAEAWVQSFNRPTPAAEAA
jgi:hypothetical protein